MAVLSALCVSSPGPVLALMLLAALVPSALLLGASQSELARLERRWSGWLAAPVRPVTSCRAGPGTAPLRAPPLARN